MNKYRVKNWANFQHYKDRKPAWIKLHRDILDDFAFQSMPDASRALAPCIWLLASEHEGGEFPADHSMLAFRFRRTEKEIDEAMKPLIAKGFLTLVQDASEPLAERYQDAMPEKEREGEKEREKKQKCAGTLAKPDYLDDEVWQDFLTHRKNKKAPLTKSAWKNIDKEIRKGIAKGLDPNELMGEAMAAGWQGFNLGWYENRVKPNEGEGKKRPELREFGT